MSRRLSVLAGLCVLASATAASAIAGQPGGAPPFQPPPSGSPCSQGLPHPIVCARFAVSCPAHPRVAGRCETTAATRPAHPAATLITFSIARRIGSLVLDCRSTPANSIACRVVRFTTMAGTGVRTVLSSLPGAFTRVRVSCAMGAHDLFACHV
jgi:hypothetical protein